MIKGWTWSGAYASGVLRVNPSHPKYKKIIWITNEIVILKFPPRLAQIKYINTFAYLMKMHLKIKYFFFLPPIIKNKNSKLSRLVNNKIHFINKS